MYVECTPRVHAHDMASEKLKEILGICCDMLLLGTSWCARKSFHVRIWLGSILTIEARMTCLLHHDSSKLYKPSTKLELSL